MTGGKRRIAGFGVSALLAAALMPAIGSAQILDDGAGVVETPNILLIIGDDMGNETLSCYGLNSDTAKTPTLDDLCTNGVRFDNFWSQPVCSPTRATMLTGRYGFRTGVGRPTGDRGAMGDFPEPPPKPAAAPAEPPPREGGRRRENAPTDWGLPLSEFTLPLAFRANSQLGYATAAIGKWHLSDARNGWERHPNLVGFDHFAGLIRGFPSSFFTWNKAVNGEWSGETGYAPTDKSNDAIDWIKSREDRPWFLWFAFNLPHTPLHLPPRELWRSDYSEIDPQANPQDGDQVMYFDAMIEAMDAEIERLLASLSPEVRANTYVIFMGDNGSGGRTVRPPFGQGRAKGSIYQGGINVPLIVTGPGVAAGAASSALVNSTDMFDTILEMAGIDAVQAVPQGVRLDSVSFMPYLENPDMPSLREFVYADQFDGNFAGIEAANYAMRNSQYKRLRHNGTVEFYNLEKDPYEHENLLDRELTEPEQAQFDALGARLEALRSERQISSSGAR